MHDRDRRSDYGERRGAGREPERPEYGGGWHRGSDYGGRGGYGRYDDRSERDRDRMGDERRRDRFEPDERYRREGNRSGRYDYANEGYGGAYRRDRDDRWGGGFGEEGGFGTGRRQEDRSGYERHGEYWRRDAERRHGRSREPNWGAAFNAGEYGRETEGLGYSNERRFSEGREPQGRPSDRYDERGAGARRYGERERDFDEPRGREGRYGEDRPRRDEERRGGYEEPTRGYDPERDQWRHSHDRQRFDEPSEYRREQSRELRGRY